MNVWYSKYLLNISHTASVSINNQIYKKGGCVDVVDVVVVCVGCCYRLGAERWRVVGNIKKKKTKERTE